MSHGSRLNGAFLSPAPRKLHSLCKQVATLLRFNSSVCSSRLITFLLTRFLCCEIEDSSRGEGTPLLIDLLPWPYSWKLFTRNTSIFLERRKWYPQGPSILSFSQQGFNFSKLAATNYSRPSNNFSSKIHRNPGNISNSLERSFLIKGMSDS